MDSAGCGGYESLGQDLKNGMTFVISVWQSDDGIDWLQHGKCQGVCNSTGNETISNLVIATGDYVAAQKEARHSNIFLN